MKNRLCLSVLCLCLVVLLSQVNSETSTTPTTTANTPTTTPEPNTPSTTPDTTEPETTVPSSDASTSTTDDTRPDTTTEIYNFTEIDYEDEEEKEPSPWQLSVRAYGLDHICGATLINIAYAITSQHCLDDWMADVKGNVVYNPKGLSVYAGVKNMEEDGRQDRPVLSIHRYKRSSDIALLKFAEFNNSIGHIVPITIGNLKKDVNKTTCKMTGWGSLYPGNATSKNLLQSKMEFAGTGQCTKKKLVVREDQACVVSNGKGGCNGDEGGPLVCKKKGVPDDTEEPHDFLLVGTESRGGVDCRSDKAPTVVTVSRYYRVWLSPFVQS